MAHAYSSEIEPGHPAPMFAEPADSVPRRIGRWLRDARLQRGLDLDDVAEELRIKAAYLQALEAGDLTAVPGRTYALGFLRCYAVSLGLDGDELVRRIKADERGETEHPELSVPMPADESRVPKMRLLVASLLLVGGIYGGWRYVNGDLRPLDDMVAAVPLELREASSVRDLPPAPAAPGNGARALAEEGPGSFQPAAEIGAADWPPVAPLTSASTERVEAAPARETVAAVADHSERPAAAPTADVAPAAAAPAPPPRDGARAGSEPSAAELLARLAVRPADGARETRVYGRVNGDARVRLEAVDTSWIQVRSADNTYTYTRTLQPGDVFLVPNRTDLGLWTGNAGGLRVIVDGRSLPPLGVPNEVKRDLPLDPERLLARVEGAVGRAADGRR